MRCLPGLLPASSTFAPRKWPGLIRTWKPAVRATSPGHPVAREPCRTSHPIAATHPACTVTGCAAVTNCCHRVFSTVTSLFDTLSHAGQVYGGVVSSPGTGDCRPVLAVRCGSGPGVGTCGVLLGLRAFNAVTGNGVTRPGVMTQVQPPGTLRFDMDQQAEA